jgi:threonyl-tRNA synthetase
VDLDERQEKIGYKIREAQLQKVPYMLVVGDRESAEGTVAVRERTLGDLGSKSIEAFEADAKLRIQQKDKTSVKVAPVEYDGPESAKARR